MRWIVLVVSTLAALGCRAGFKSTGGGATSPAGLGAGASHSLRFSDEGGVLTRAALAAVGIVGAAGAVSDVKVKTEYVNDGSMTKEIKTTTGTVDTKQAGKAAAYLNAVGDPDTKLSTGSFSLGASLEIASRTLGGDTSGGQFDFGVGYKHASKLGAMFVLIRAYAAFGYGHYTFHDRQMIAVDRGPPKFGDGEYKFTGIPTRLGVFLGKIPDSLKDFVGVEAYGKVDVNFSDAMVYHLGGRFQYSLGFVELEMLRGSKSDLDGVGLEIGLGF